MLKGKKIIVVMPAYNAAQTLRMTYDEVMEQDIVDLVILVDDGSRDETVSIAKTLPATVVYAHERNRGYGGNQKSCYRLALEEGGDVIIMVHPDYQYTPKLIPAMASMIASGLYPCVLGSRILGGYALKGGMPVWKYAANRFLTLVENILLGAKLSEYHTGYRAFSRKLLQQLPLDNNSDDFVFDNQMLAQIIWYGNTIAEISCPTKYFAEASSINFTRSVKYGLGCLLIALKFRLAKMKIVTSKLFPKD
jgi:glycosyltransferase involved in cell wall biosynthesis